MIEETRDLTTLTRTCRRCSTQAPTRWRTTPRRAHLPRSGCTSTIATGAPPSLAYANAAAIVGLSMLTDYPGGMFPVLSFRAHGQADLALTALDRGGPRHARHRERPGCAHVLRRRRSWRPPSSRRPTGPPEATVGPTTMYVTPREEWRDGPDAPWNT